MSSTSAAREPKARASSAAIQGLRRRDSARNKAIGSSAALSALWSLEGSQSILESERTLVYAAVLAAVVILVDRRETSAFAGVAVAIAGVCSYSLATRLFPDHFGFIVDPSVNRLERPIGYWNSLGTFAAMGFVLSFGFAARSKSLLMRGLASAALPLRPR